MSAKKPKYTLGSHDTVWLTAVDAFLLIDAVIEIIYLLFKSGVPNLSLTMYPFSISTDENVPLKFLMTKYCIMPKIHRYIQQ